MRSHRHFDDLFHLRKHKLLHTVKQLELSPHVQRDIDSMKTRVVKLREKYDELRRQRQCKEATLFQHFEQITSLPSVPDSPLTLEQQENSLKSALFAAHLKLESEEIYTRKLEYMKETRLKQVISAKEPIENTRFQLKQINTKLEAARDVLLRESLAYQAIASFRVRKEGELQENQVEHAKYLHQKAQEYRSRSEIHEFVDRFEQQKSLQSRIFSNEATVRDLIERVKAAKEANEGENELLANEKLVEGYEIRLKSLMDVTGTNDLDGIVGYWVYLQGNKQEIEGNIAEMREKVDKLREIYKEESEGLRGMLLLTNPEAVESLKSLQSMHIRSRKSVISLSNWKEGVNFT